MGIYTSEPVASALKKCPNLLIFPPDHEMYRQYSHLFIDYLKTLTPDIEQVSVDECYLDFTGIAHRYGSPLEAADEIKTRFMSVWVYGQCGDLLQQASGEDGLDFEKPDRVHFSPRRSRGKCASSSAGVTHGRAFLPPRS